MQHNRYKDLTGMIYGERTVLNYSHKDPVSRNYYWNVVCSCGREDKVAGSRLKNGTANRCVECSGRENGRKGLDTQAKNMSVYFVKCGNFVKVGASHNPKKRLKTISVFNPYDVELLKVDTSKTEKEWHDLLKEYHHKGEWFRYDGVCEIVDLT